MKKSFSTKQAHIIASALRADYATGIIKPEYLIVMPDGKRYAVALKETADSIKSIIPDTVITEYSMK